MKQNSISNKIKFITQSSDNQSDHVRVNSMFNHIFYLLSKTIEHLSKEAHQSSDPAMKSYLQKLVNKKISLRSTLEDYLQCNDIAVPSIHDEQDDNGLIPLTNMSIKDTFNIIYNSEVAAIDMLLNLYVIETDPRVKSFLKQYIDLLKNYLFDVKIEYFDTIANMPTFNCKA